jgi:1-hydroxycarotenoid 3,4-desaturase
VIGAGVGGLATALRLLTAGFAVTVLERGPRPGGKMRQVPVGGDRFDGGPSVMTMPWVLDDLLATAGVARADVLSLSPLSPLCRHFFADGSVLDLFADEPVPADSRHPEVAWQRSADEIARVIGRRAADEYARFRRHAATIYRAVEGPFLRRPLPHGPLEVVTSFNLRDALGMLRLDALRSLWRAVCSQFSDERLRILFARYATYSGADPFVAPATLAVIPHVELAFGVYSVAGGMYSVAACLAELIERHGGHIRCGAEVERIELDPRGENATAVIVAGERITADYVVANCDAVQVYSRLLSGSRTADRHAQAVAALEPSLSAYLNLFVVDGDGVADLPLVHHNVFFSRDYEREWQELRSGPPSDPTVYLCNPDFAQRHQRWFCLTNSPPLSESGSGPWNPTLRTACRERVVQQLARHHIALSPILQAEGEVTPQDFDQLFPLSRGAIYGPAASSRLGAFARPRNRVPGIENLFCVGGSTHPGAGVPMVMLSAAIVSDLLKKQHNRGSRRRVA